MAPGSQPEAPMTAVATLTVSAPGDCHIVLTRTFSATRSRVYEAFTTPELLKQWVGPRGWNLTRAEVDNRIGGRYRFEGGAPGKPTLGWGGEVRELVPGSRIVQTEAFDDYPGEAINTTTWEEKEGKTVVRVVMEYPSREVRDGVLASGMARGVEESYDRLEELLTNPA